MNCFVYFSKLRIAGAIPLLWTSILDVHSQRLFLKIGNLGYYEQINDVLILDGNSENVAYL